MRLIIPPSRAVRAGQSRAHRRIVIPPYERQFTRPCGPSLAPDRDAQNRGRVRGSLPTSDRDLVNSETLRDPTPTSTLAVVTRKRAELFPAAAALAVAGYGLLPTVALNREEHPGPASQPPASQHQHLRPLQTVQALGTRSGSSYTALSASEWDTLIHCVLVATSPGACRFLTPPRPIGVDNRALRPRVGRSRAP